MGGGGRVGRQGGKGQNLVARRCLVETQSLGCVLGVVLWLRASGQTQSTLLVQLTFKFTPHSKGVSVTLYEPHIPVDANH